MKEILAQLDPTNDNHWTQDGLPRLDTVKLLAGNPAITREQLENEAPGFNRTTATAPAQAPPPPQSPTGSGDSLRAAPTPPAGPAAGNSIADSQGNTHPDEIEMAQDDVSFCLREVAAAQAALAKAQAHHDRLVNERDLVKPSKQEPLMDYLASQRQMLAERGRQQDEIRKSGLNLGRLISGLRSPLDNAFKNRPRG